MVDPALTPRERRLVTLAAAASSEPIDERVDAAASDAIAGGDLTATELLEVVLHVAVYAGWPRAAHLELVLGQQWARIHEARGEAPPTWPELPPDAVTTGVQRRAAGLARFEEVNGFPSPPCDTPYRQAVVEWVFGDLWWRPGLNRRDRRLLSIACVALTGAPFPLAIHVGTALTSGDLAPAAMDEVVALLTPSCSPARAAALTAAVAQATAE